MRTILVVLSILALVGSMLFSSIYHSLDYTKSLELFNHETCKKVSNFSGVEDMTMFDDVAIGITGNLFELIDRSNIELENGGLVVIDPKKQTVEGLELKGFPKDVAFHPHGLFLFEKRLLYVINHAFKYGGERVEVFSITKSPKVEVTYLRTIQFPDTEIGRLNDLVVVAEDSFYVTTWLPEGLDKNTGKSHELMDKIRFTFSLMYLETTGINYCTNNKGQAQCEYDIVKGHIMNGITTDGTDIFAVEVANKELRHYSINPDHSLTELERISLFRSFDNVEFDPATGNLYGASIGAIGKHLEFAERATPEGFNFPRDDILYPGGTIEVYKKNGEWRTREILLQNDLFGVAGAVRSGDTIMLGSWFDEGVVFCKPKF